MNRFMRRMSSVSRAAFTRRPLAAASDEAPRFEPLERRELMNGVVGGLFPVDPYAPVHTVQNGQLFVDDTWYGTQAGFQLAGFSRNDLGVGVYGSFLPNLADNSITSSADLVGNTARPFGIAARTSATPQQLAGIFGIDPNNPGPTQYGAAFRIYQDVLRQTGGGSGGSTGSSGGDTIVSGAGALVSGGIVRGKSPVWQGFGLGQSQTLNLPTGTAEISLKGDGAGIAVPIIPGVVDIIVAGSSERTSIDIRTTASDLIVRNFVALGSLKSLNAPTTDLVHGLGIKGWAGSITLDDAIFSSIIVSEASPRGKAVNIQLDVVRDMTIDSRAPIGKLTVTDWRDTNGVADLLRAPALDKLTVSGNAKFGGNFEPSMALFDGGRKATLNSVMIAGDVGESVWLAGGDVSNVRIDGVTDGLRLLAGGEIESIQMGDTQNATIFAADGVGAVITTRWIEGLLLAPTASSITATFDPGVLPSGNMSADVIVPGRGDGRPAIGKVSIDERLSGTWKIGGSVGEINATALDGFIGAIDGELKKLSVGLRIFNGGLAARSIGSVDIGGNFERAVLFAGNPVEPGTIGKLRIGGDVTRATVRIGLWPVDGAFDNGNDILVGGMNSRLKSLTINGTMDDLSLFMAGDLPRTISLNGERLDPADDGRFLEHTI